MFGSEAWDVVIVGAGHNGLAAAAYLAQAGKRVLVLERRDRVGGACTLEQPFADERWLVSPCAYLVGLLDPLVIDELELRRHGYRVHLVDPHLWCPFEDDAGTAAVHLMHSMGTLEGTPGAWGYVQGGMGRVSIALSRAAEEAGATVATGVEVGAIVPGEGVQLMDGELVQAPIVVSNADPKR